MAILDRLKKDEGKNAKKGADAKAKDSKKKAATPKSSVVVPAALSSVIVRPVVTEKATLTNTYVFEVRRTANKTQVAKAVAALYGVHPVSVRIMNVRGKKVRVGYKNEGKRADWKKAVIRLADGESINVYQGT